MLSGPLLTLLIEPMKDMDEPADPDGLGEEVIDTVGAARVLAAPRTPNKS